MLMLGIANAVLFFRATTITWAFWTLAIATALKAIILAQDYRLVLNQHYMALWIAVVYLAVPGKRRCLRVSVRPRPFLTYGQTPV
jgi:hypothetical protein